MNGLAPRYITKATFSCFLRHAEDILHHYIISKIMIIAFSFHRIIVNVLLIMIKILFTETEISSKNAKQAQYRVNRLLQVLSLHPKAFKIQTLRGESGFSRVIP